MERCYEWSCWHGRKLKTITNDKDALKDLYGKVLGSGLRDKHLKMYTVSADLAGQSYDMGLIILL